MNTCFPCFSSTRQDEEREPLLPKHRPSHPPSPDEPLKKLIDVLAASRAGKLPSQTQINDFLRRILHSNILQEAQDLTHGMITPEILQGNGPLSSRGRKVVQDLAEVIRALLQFGMEKNDDDLIQDLFAHLWQIENDESLVSFATSRDDARNKEHEMRKRVGKLKEGIKDQTPGGSEVSEDAKTMVKAIKSLLVAFLSSSAFRLILMDAIQIGRELVAHVAFDVGNVASHVHDLAEDLERKAAGQSVKLSEGGDLKEIVTSSVQEGVSTASSVAQGMHKSIKEGKEELENRMPEAEEEVKRRLLTRIGEMVSRAQADASSRTAIIAIMQIIRKYAHKIESATREVVATMQGTSVVDSSSERGKHESGGLEGVPIGFADSSYPPQPYNAPPVLTAGIKINSTHLQNVIQDTKIMLERLAQGHKIDDMMRTLEDIVRCSVTLPSNSQMGGSGMEAKFGHDGGEPSSFGTRGVPSSDHHVSRATLFSKYFSSIGRYIDEALAKPGWAASEAGQRSLEKLYDATRELLRMAGEVVADAGNVVGEEVERIKKLDQREIETGDFHLCGDSPGAVEDSWIQAGSNVPTAEEKASEDVHDASQCLRDISMFFKQAEDYFDAMERDRTTMKLVRALETLKEDIEDLFGAGRKELRGGLGLYTQWLGWALPRLLRLLPLEAIPVPRIEIKTDNVECAIDALMIRGLALDDEQRRYGATGGQGGIGGKLVPDEVLIQQWTETKVTFAAGRGAMAIGARDAQHRMGLAGKRRGEVAPGVEVTSRLRVRADGMKACARAMGYYFKYAGAFFDYEDEGVLSVDLGTTRNGGIHSGFGLDIELEMDSSTVGMDTVAAANTTIGVPIITVEHVETDEDIDPLDRCELSDSHPDSKHLPRQISPDGALEPSEVSIDVALARVMPLFKVLDVRVDLRGVRFKIDESRHWLFNKLIVEPFGTSVVRDAARRALQERIRKTSEAVSAGMALVVMEAKERAMRRRMRFGEDNGTGMKISDFCAILIKRGPEILGYYLEPSQQDGTGTESTSTETHAQVTSRGLVFSKQTHAHVESQPGASGNNVPTTIPSQRMVDDDDGEQRIEESLTVAVGSGPQLFPGKGGPYGSNGKSMLGAVQGGVEELSKGYRCGKTEECGIQFLV